MVGESGIEFFSRRIRFHGKVDSHIRWFRSGVPQASFQTSQILVSFQWQICERSQGWKARN